MPIDEQEFALEIWRATSGAGFSLERCEEISRDLLAWIGQSNANELLPLLDISGIASDVQSRVSKTAATKTLNMIQIYSSDIRMYVAEVLRERLSKLTTKLPEKGA